MNKYIRFAGLWWLIAIVLGVEFPAFAQSSISVGNRLRIPDIQVQRGKSAAIPVIIDNVDHIGAFQFDWICPAGVNPTGDITIADRADAFAISIQDMGNNCWRALGYSPDDQPMAGNSGVAFYIIAKTSSNVNEGDTLAMKIENVTLAKLTGEGLPFSSEVGNIIVALSPDLTVLDVKANKTKVQPGDELQINFAVTNLGALPTNGGWTENIVLTNGTQRRSLGSQYNALSLGGGEKMQRSIDASIPTLPLMEGECFIEVKIIPNAECGEPASAITNNTVLSAEPLTLAAQLWLTPESDRVQEGKKSQLRCKATRSGNVATAQAFSLSLSSEDSRISIPESINIDQGQSSAYFTINIADNKVLDTDSICTIAIAGNQYPAANASFTIIDDELPYLRLIASKESITEGDSLTLTLNAEIAPKEDVLVAIYCDYPERFAFPTTLTLPAGQTSVSGKLKAIDNRTAENTIAALFEIAADGYVTENALIELLDNDVPKIALSLTADTIGENQGQNAVQGKLVRSSLTDERVTIMLSDDTQGRITLSSHAITFKPGETEKSFSIDVNDNELVDTQDRYEITAAVYLSSCGCQATQSSVGAASATLIIVDDDGKSLKVTPSSKSWIEGYKKGFITVSRNTSTEEALTIDLTCDNPKLLKLANTATILAGDRQVQIPVEVLTNATTDDETVVNITASAPEFAQGRNWVRIVDYSRPDAIISNFELSDSVIEANGYVTATAVVRNDGVATMPKNALVQFYSNASPYPLMAYTQKALEPGEENIVSQKMRLPDKVGIYTLYATINGDSKFSELDSLNNRSAFCPIQVISGVNAVVTTDKSIYDSGENVTINGKFNGANAANREMNVYVTNNIYRQTMTVRTDSTGAFTHTFTPYPSQIGNMTIGACYSGEYVCENEAAIEIYGIEGSLGSNRAEIDLNDTFTTKLRINNPTKLPITGLKLSATNIPDNCTLTLGEISELKANSYVEIPISIVATSPSQSNEFHNIGINLKGNNGISFSKTIYYFCHTPLGKLYTSFSPVETTISQGSTRDYTISLQNRGKGETGTISISLPQIDWISAVTPTQLPSLQAGESCSMILRLSGTESMKLNVTNHCSVAVNCAKSDGLLLQFTAKCVSEKTGKLIVDVCDEYTYYQTSAPRVANASIALRDPSNGNVLFTGVSDQEGRYVAEIPAGLYTMSVAADKHESSTYSIEVAPGQENKETANISVKGVTMSYNVVKDVETETYETEINTTFETNVPVPVVIMDGPTSVEGDAMKVGESMILDFTLTNHGMIQAENVYLQVPSGNEEFTLEPLMSVGPFALAPNETRKVPLLLTRIADGTTRAPQRAALRAVDDDPDGINYNPDWLPKTYNTYFNNCMVGFAYWYYHNCGSELVHNLSAFKMAVRACMYGSLGSAIASEIAVYDPDNDGSGIPPILYYLLYGAPYPELEDYLMGSGPAGENIPGVYDPSWDSNHDLIRRQMNICNPIVADCALHAMDRPLGDWDRAGIVSNMNAYADGWATGVAEGHDPTASAVASALENLRDNAVDQALAAGSESDNEVVSAICTTTSQEMEERQRANDLEMCIEAYEAVANAVASEANRPTQAPSEFSIVPDWMKAHLQASKALVEMLQAFNDLCQEIFGNAIWYNQKDNEISELISAIGKLNKLDVTVENLKDKQPSIISAEDFELFIERFYNTVNHIAADNSADIEHVDMIRSEMNELTLLANQHGYASVGEWYDQTYADFVNNYYDEDKSVCASVGIALSQSVAISREVVRGILEVYNGNEDSPLRELRMTVKILDPDGNLANQKFVIQTDSTEGFAEGGNEVDGYTLQSDATGRINLKFVPKTDAEMEEPTDYEFGGVVSYIDPYTGTTTSIELYPTTLTINPSPILDMTYFLQRDVIGDDPLTTDVVEDSQPAELALLIHNTGNGDALDVNIVTHKPQIVRNDKNLAISDFELLSSSLNGYESSLPIDGEVSTAFGSIPAHCLTFAQWWFRSVILGHFIDYDVNLVKDSQYGSEASLIGEMSVHELIRSVEAPGYDNEPIVAFLVNDIVDANDLPDHLYCTDGTIHLVSNVSNSNITASEEKEYKLSFNAKTSGWTYGKISDPTNGRGYLSQVVRIADGQEMPLRNFWITNVTLRDAKEPLHENMLHFIDSISQDGMAEYALLFEDMKAEQLYVKSITGIHDNTQGVVEAFLLTFSKPVVQSTFGSANIALSRDGVQVQEQIEVEWINDSQCQIILANMASKPGEYAISINLDKVTDQDGLIASGISTYRWSLTSPDGINDAIFNVNYRLESAVVRENIRILGDLSLLNSCVIYTAAGSIASISAIDTDGRINVSNLPVGVYLIQLNSDSSFTTLRFIKH